MTSCSMILGTSLWFCMLHSGIHATLSGVILAFALPFKSGKPHTLSYRVEHSIQWPVSYVILPLFALANTAILIPEDTSTLISNPASLGIFFGLVVGKPLGIVLASLLAVKLGIASLSSNINFKMHNYKKQPQPKCLVKMFKNQPTTITILLHLTKSIIPNVPTKMRILYNKNRNIEKSRINDNFLR